MKEFLVVFYGLFFTFNLYSQDEFNFRDLVSEKSIKDSLFVFGEWNEDGGTETHLKYLGELVGDQKSFKILTSCWIWGLSRRATNRILIYNVNNELLGNFKLDVSYELPDRIENNALIIGDASISKESDNLIRINFEDGLPDFINIIRGNSENTYWFEIE